VKALHCWLSRHSAKIVPKIVNLAHQEGEGESSAMEVMSSRSSMDNSFSSSHETEGKNVATYYFRHESGDSECETSSDEGMGRSTAALNYSREDIQALATQAELMVLGRIENRREMEAAAVVDGDSDYSSNHNLSPLVSSEPNLQRRTSPKRRVLNSRRRDWRNSLPECLEFYHHAGQQHNRSLQHSVSTGGERAASSSPHKQHQPPSSDSQISDSDEGSVAAQERLSAPELSELWEEEQCQSEDLAWSDEGGEQDLPGLLSFGEDYGRFLKRLGDTASSCSDGEESLPGRRCRRRKSLKNQRKEKKTEEEVKEQKGERLWNVRGKLQEMARGLQELGDDLDQARTEDRLSLVCELKQEVGLVARSLEEAHAQLLSPAFDAGEKEKVGSKRWWSWGITTSLILLSLVSFGSAIVSCLQPHCCSDPSNSWAILSNPVTFSYVNGPPPI